MDPKTNLDVIQKRLVSIFNKKTPSFTGIVDDETITIVNENGMTCLTMPCPSYDEVEYVIYDVEINKCSDVPKNGTQTLLNIIEFGKKYKYDLLKINNFSEINFTGKEASINLTLLKLLTIGNSWYSQFGFNNDFAKEMEPQILPLIHFTFEQFKSLGIPFFSKFIKNSTDRFSGTCFQISPTDKICNYFKRVEQCFSELCPMRVCRDIYFIKLQNVFMRKMLFFIFCAIEPCEYSKYEKIVDEKLGMYVELELNFHEGRGRSKKKFINRRSHTKKAMTKNS